MRADLRFLQRGSAGFTLLEVLVALVIAAMACIVLFRGVASGTAIAVVAGHTEEALTRARSRLAALAAGPLTPGERNGDDGGGFQWQTRVTENSSVPLPGQEAVGTQAPRLVLYDLRIAITWRMDGGERRVVLDSARLGTAAAAPP